MESVKSKELFCPHCKSKKMQRSMGSASTSVYYPPIYKDGANISVDRNIITTSMYCMECHKYYEVKSQNSNPTLTIIKKER